MPNRNSESGFAADSDLPLNEIKRLARQIHACELVSLHHVREEAVHGVTQILQTTGADMRITLEDSNDERLFKKLPKCRI